MQFNHVVFGHTTHYITVQVAITDILQQQKASTYFPLLQGKHGMAQSCGRDGVSCTRVRVQQAKAVECGRFQLALQPPHLASSFN